MHVCSWWQNCVDRIYCFSLKSRNRESFLGGFSVWVRYCTLPHHGNLNSHAELTADGDLIINSLYQLCSLYTHSDRFILNSLGVSKRQRAGSLSSSTTICPQSVLASIDYQWEACLLKWDHLEGQSEASSMRRNVLVQQKNTLLCAPFPL